jgi:hypothetical protein
MVLSAMDYTHSCWWDRTLSHSLDTSLSASCLQLIRFSIQPSSVAIDPGSLVGDSLCGSGIFPTSTSIFESMLSSCLAQTQIPKFVGIKEEGDEMRG